MASSDFSLNGKIAFVTGGARGLGRVFAEALLEKGAKVAFIDINDETGLKTESELQEKHGKDRVYFIKSDITNLEELRGSYDKCIQKFGNIDIVVNNAGMADEINFERMIELNLTALIRSSYIAVEKLRKDKGGKGGCIINIASDTALIPKHFMVVYSASKHGVVGFTKALAINIGDTERFGVRVAAVCPASVKTNLSSVDAWLNVEPTREADITLPDFKGALAFRIEELKNKIWLPPSRVSDVMLSLIAEPDCNGAIVLITPDTSEYVHPQSCIGKKLY